MRAANSLESLDSVSSSIQQARASSSTVQPPRTSSSTVLQQRTGSSTVQPQRTGSGTVQPPRTGSGTVQPVRTGSGAPARANPVNPTLTPPTQARSSHIQARTTPVQIRKFSNTQVTLFLLLEIFIYNKKLKYCQVLCIQTNKDDSI